MGNPIISPGDYEKDLQRIYQRLNADLLEKVYDRHVIILEEEFLSGIDNVSGGIGKLGWNFASAGGVGTYGFQAGESDHPGIYRIASHSDNTDAMWIYLSRNQVVPTAQLPCILANQIDAVSFIVRIPTITTCMARVGLSDDLTDVTAAQWGANAAWFDFTPASSANWRTYTRAAAVSSAAQSTGIAVTAGNWYVLKIIRTAGGNFTFYVNDILKTTHATNQPTVVINAGAQIKTLTTAQRTLDLDYFRLKTARFGNRYT